MTFKMKPQQKIPQFEVDLTGEEGNVFYLIGLARKLAPKLGLVVETITDGKMFDDYTHAIRTFDAYFGDYVTLFTDNTMKFA